MKSFINFLPPWVETNIQPAFYDKESGTVLQQTARMYAKVNQLVRHFNCLAKETKETVEEYIAKFVELKDFVDTYFENLDVQEEINNKLDEMADDGTLQEIIGDYLNANAVWGFDNVADMKASTNLINGSFARTLGYYAKNDGGDGLYKIRAIDNTDVVDEGAIIAMDDVTLVAELIVEDNQVNVKQFGAKGDGTTDDTAKIQNALDSGYDVYVPNGTYLVTSTLVMPFNIKLIGESKVTSVIKSTVDNDFTLTYGSSYNYGNYKGLIKELKITSENVATNKPKGIKLYSGCVIERCEFSYIGQAIARVSNYIDLIKIEDTAFLYCVPNNNYIVDIAGNADALTLAHLKFESYTEDSTMYNGIHIGTCHGGSISDSILNCNLFFEMCSAFSINNLHTEGLTRVFEIKNSNVSFNNVFKFKNETNNDILIEADAHKDCIVELNNFIFTRNASNIALSATEEIAELPINTILHIKDCYRHFNLADAGDYANICQGIAIKNNASYNTLSGKYSKDSFITNEGVDSDYRITNESASALGTTGKSNKIKWLADSEASVHYRGVFICDETRKIICGYSSDASVSSLTTNGDGAVIAVNAKYAKDLYLYAGTASDTYTKLAKIPMCGRNRIYDDGIQANTVEWETVTSTNGRDGYTNVQRFVKDGDNVIIYYHQTPSYGTWKKFDKIINTSHTTGQPLEWEYDGTNWIAKGSY